MKRFSYLIVLIIATLIGFSLTPGSRAQSNVANVIECAKVPDRERRLSCYDQRINDLIIEMQSQPVDARPLGPSSGVETAAARPSRESEPLGASWGLRSRPQRGDEVTELQAQLVRFSVDSLGKYTFYLTNGQVWKQKYTRRLNVHDGDPVSVKKGFLSGFRLKVGTNQPIRVARVE